MNGKLCRLEIPADLLEKLRIAVAREGHTVNGLIRHFIRAEVERSRLNTAQLYWRDNVPQQMNNRPKPNSAAHFHEPRRSLSKNPLGVRGSKSPEVIIGFGGMCAETVKAL